MKEIIVRVSRDDADVIDQRTREILAAASAGDTEQVSNIFHEYMAFRFCDGFNGALARKEVNSCEPGRDHRAGKRG
jgi:hypothetical protein